MSDGSRRAVTDVSASGASRASDAQLLAAPDDAQAFRTVYDRHVEMVFGLFRRRGVDHHAALDLTAETFAAAWIGRGRYIDRGDGNAGPWLCGVARNVLSHSARHRAVVTTARERLGMLAERRPFDPVALGAIDGLDPWSPDVDDALAALSQASRDAVELRIVHGATYDEIAEALECSPLAARIRVSRALAQLRAELSHRRGGIEHAS